MNRRDALNRVALIFGGTIVGAEFFLNGCKPASKEAGASLNFTADNTAFLNEVAETILPATSSPGAKEAKVGDFMTVMVKDCYEEGDQKIFLEGMGKLDEACKAKNGSYFMDCTPQQRHDILVDIDKEAKDYAGKKKPEDANHYFTMMKQLTLLGYFTSEPGATKALRYVAVPGRYDGCVPYTKGEKAWATS